MTAAVTVLAPISVAIAATSTVPNLVNLMSATYLILLAFVT